MAVHLRGAGPTDDPGGTQVLDLRTVSFGLLASLCARPFWTGRELVAELQVALT